MIEADILFPVTCPTCAHEALTGFRMAVITEALETGQIRLYSTCHLLGWDASHSELDQICEYLDVARSAAMGKARKEIDLESSVEQKSPVYVHTGTHDQIKRDHV
jgi:hypothetical protein